MEARTKITTGPVSKAKKKASTHPTFYAMVSDAIVTLKERTGSSQYAIQKFAEEKHKQLPPNFRKLLLVQLKRLVAAGKLVKVKNSYKLSPLVKKDVQKKPNKSAAEVAKLKPKTKTVSRPKTTKSVKKATTKSKPKPATKATKTFAGASPRKAAAAKKSKKPVAPTKKTATAPKGKIVKKSKIVKSPTKRKSSRTAK